MPTGNASHPHREMRSAAHAPAKAERRLLWSDPRPEWPDLFQNGIEFYFCHIDDSFDRLDQFVALVIPTNWSAVWSGTFRSSSAHSPHRVDQFFTRLHQVQ